VSSKAQRRANRRNAQRSTGPRTAPGKSVARNNSLKHGLTQPSKPADLDVWIAALGDGEAAFRLAVAQDLISRVRRRRQALIEAAETGDGTGVAEVAVKLLSLDDYERRARSGRRKALAAMENEAIWENEPNSPLALLV
jgi:hypothetical protein